MWPKKPRRVPGRAQTSLRAIADVAGRRDRSRHPGSGRTVANDRECQHAHQRADGGGAGECGRPSAVAEQRDEWDGRQDLPQLTDDCCHLGHQRHPPGRKPPWDERQCRGEDDRIAGADQNSRGGRDGHGRRVCQQELPGGQQHCVGDEHRPRPVPVHQKSRRDLCCREDGHLDEHEGGQGAGAESEPIGGVKTRSGEGGPLHDGQDVGGHAYRPDQPGDVGPRRHCGGGRVHGDARFLMGIGHLRQNLATDGESMAIFGNMSVRTVTLQDVAREADVAVSTVSKSAVESGQGQQTHA